jgi:hypothetical protein
MRISESSMTDCANSISGRGFEERGYDKKVFGARQIIVQCGASVTSWEASIFLPGSGLLMEWRGRLKNEFSDLTVLHTQDLESVLVLQKTRPPQEGRTLRTGKHPFMGPSKFGPIEPQVPRFGIDDLSRGLLDILFDSSNFGATDLRDKIYGTVGMAGILTGDTIPKDGLRDTS